MGNWHRANGDHGKEPGPSLVSIIVPLYNGKDMIRQLLTSISESSYKNIEVIVIDDASTDRGGSVVEKEFPWVRVLVNDVNRGKSWSINRGISLSSGSLIVVTDPDMTLDRRLLSTWVNALDKDFRIGVGGAYVYYKDSPTVLTHAGAKLDTRNAKIPHQLVNTPFEYNREYYEESPDFIFDDIYVLRRSAVDIVGPYDFLNFHTIYEEADLQIRMSNAGVVKAIIPGARAFHAIPIRQWKQMQRYSKYKIELFCRNRLILLRKFGILNYSNGLSLLLPMLAYYALIGIVQPVPLSQRLSLLTSAARGVSRGLRDPIVRGRGYAFE
jgi:glycosyltransferase involved in cell wall biosynthesis